MKYRSIIKVEFREFDRRVLDKTWEWLHDPEIKYLMYSPDMTRESQLKWFQGLKQRNDYFVEAVWRNEDPIGVVGLKNITVDDAEIFGYIGEKEYWGKAIGMDMMQRLLYHARSRGLSSVYAQILKINRNSYKLHRRFGFDLESEVDDKTIKMRLHL